MSFGDKDLLAYLDGDMALRDEIEAALAQDAELERRLMALDPMAGPVRAAFEGIPAAGRLPTLEALEPTAEVTAPARSGLWKIAAALIVGVGLGAGVVLSRGGDDLRWQDQVAIYQALYVPETVARLVTDEATLAEQFDQADAALGLTLPRDALSALDGLDLRRAQILGIEDAPLIQIVFANETGAPIAFCILRQNGTASATETETLSGLPVAHWSDGDFGYMLVGELGPDQMSMTAQQLRALF